MSKFRITVCMVFSVLFLLWIQPGLEAQQNPRKTVKLLDKPLDLGLHYVGKVIPVSYEYVNNSDADQRLKFVTEFHALKVNTRPGSLAAGDKLEINAEIDTSGLKAGKHQFVLLIHEGKEIKELDMVLTLENMYIQTPRVPMMYQQANWRTIIRLSPAVKGLVVDKLEYKVPGLKHRIENGEGIVKLHFQGSDRTPAGPYVITVKPKNSELYPEFKVKVYPMRGISTSDDQLNLYQDSPSKQIFLRDYDGKPFKIRGVKSPHSWMKAKVIKAENNVHLIELKVTDFKKAELSAGKLIIITDHPLSKRIEVPVYYEKQNSYLGRK